MDRLSEPGTRLNPAPPSQSGAIVVGSEGRDAVAASYRIGIVLLDGFALMSYASAVEPLRAANLLSGQALYSIRHIPAVGARAVSSSGATVGADAHVGEQVDFDLLLVVAGGSPRAEQHRGLCHWLGVLDARGAVLGGVSGGPVILAQAGLMEGRRMTVHWEHESALASACPHLLIERSLYVRDRNRITCAGGSAALDMMHGLIASHHGAALAARVSDWFLHTEVRASAVRQRTGVLARHPTASPVLQHMLLAMDDHLADPLDLGQLARVSGVSGRQLNRLCLRAFGRSCMRFYRTLRLGKAEELLRHGGISVQRVAEATGFASGSHFSRCYRQQFGIPPSSVNRPPDTDTAC